MMRHYGSALALYHMTLSDVFIHSNIYFTTVWLSPVSQILNSLLLLWRVWVYACDASAAHMVNLSWEISRADTAWDRHMQMTEQS
jgi:hypothetical protein